MRFLDSDKAGGRIPASGHPLSGRATTRPDDPTAAVIVVFPRRPARARNLFTEAGMVAAALSASSSVAEWSAPAALRPSGPLPTLPTDGDSAAEGVWDLLSLLVEPADPHDLVQRLTRALLAWTKCDVVRFSFVVDSGLPSFGLRSDGTAVNCRVASAGEADAGLRVPLRFRGRELGDVCLHVARTDGCPPISLALIERVARLMSPALVRSVLTSRLQQRLRQVYVLAAEPVKLPASQSASTLEKLSARERDIVARLRGHRTPVMIARELGLSVHTVRNHLKSAFRKAGVHSQSELMTLAESAPDRARILRIETGDGRSRA